MGVRKILFLINIRQGQFTDDTSQALTILDSLIEMDFCAGQSEYCNTHLKVGGKENAFENNILGPTSKELAFKAFQEGKVQKNFQMRRCPMVRQ